MPLPKALVQQIEAYWPPSSSERRPRPLMRDERERLPGSTPRSARHAADRGFRWLVPAAACFVLLCSLARPRCRCCGAVAPRLRDVRLRFPVSSDWDPVNEQFGALVPIYGTLVTALIAMLIAVPVSFGIALFLTEIAPNWMRGPVGAAIELLAGIPSIIYGMWGLFVFVPFMAEHVDPWLDAHLGHMAAHRRAVPGPPLGIGMLTAGIVLGDHGDSVHLLGRCAKCS